MVYKRYNIGLDFIRIFSMLAVLLVHLTIYLPVPDRIRPFFAWGGAGVQCFFVLSGYLTCHSFIPKTGIASYYKKRAIRILPSYYVAIIAMMLFHHIILSDVTPDIFRIGWIRYFLGLNTMLPSANYNLWNNAYGLWTMSCFIWFYIIAPVIFKFVKSLKGAIVFWLMSFVISLIWKICIYAIFSNVAGIQSLDVLTGASPFGVLYQFAIGILVYYFLKEKKLFEGIIVLSLISACGLIANRNIFIWCSLCGLAIIAFENMNIILPSRLQNLIKIVGKESFHIYLSHLLSFAISWSIMDNLIMKDSILKYILWAFISVMIVIILCFLMRACEKVVNIIVRK